MPRSCRATRAKVTALDGKHLLTERPRARGLAVPSMPRRLPGREGKQRDPDDVLLIAHDGSYTIYHHYKGN